MDTLPCALHVCVGFFPAEMVFTERVIPVLVEAGIEWVIVANNHISRACKVRMDHENTLLCVATIDMFSPNTPIELSFLSSWGQ